MSLASSGIQSTVVSRPRMRGGQMSGKGGGEVVDSILCIWRPCLLFSTSCMKSRSGIDVGDTSAGALLCLK